MQFDDVAWLGSNCLLAPAARAGLGVLIAAGDSGWWWEPEKAFDALSKEVPPSGFARWGGDASVIEVEQWVDARRAICVGKAFQQLVEMRPRLNLRIGREVWDWCGVTALAAIKQNFLNANEPISAIFEWPNDVRPRVAREDGSEGITIAAFHSGNAWALSLVNVLPQAVKVEGKRVSDIAVGYAEELARQTLSAELVILLDDELESVLGNLDRLRKRIGAKCVIRLAASNENAESWLQVFGKSWSASGFRVDDAVNVANRLVSGVGEIVAANQTFILKSHGVLASWRNRRPPARRSGPGQFNFVARVPGAEVMDFIDRSLAREDRSVERVRREAVSDGVVQPVNSWLEGPPPPMVRVLDADVVYRGRSLKYFPLKGLFDISVAVRPKTPFHRGMFRFPDDEMDWRDDDKVLEVHLLERGQEPVTQKIKVSRLGESTSANFPYEVFPGGKVDLRFIVSEGVRIIQTARMRGMPGGEIEYFIESMPTAVGEQAKPFEVALLVNDSLGGAPSATVLTEQGIFLSSLDRGEVEAARDDFRGTIQVIVSNPDIEMGGTLLRLASKGRVLLEALKERVDGWPERLERVQLMTQDDAYFPLEYLYEGEIPENKRAQPCPSCGDCLGIGRAKNPCKIREDLEYLCPMGFIGVSAFIERRTWDRRTKVPVWMGLPKSLDERNRIENLVSVVFAASEQADKFDDAEIPAGCLPVRIGDVEKQLGQSLPTWKDWKLAVEQKNPSLLVLVAHVQDDALNIGKDDGVMIGAIGRQHVGEGEPLVIAIGCNSAISGVAKATLPAILMRHGAKVVVAALTEVLGRYSNEAALFLADRFQDAARAPFPRAIGEFMGQLRREFLARGNALGLVLVAFGDADVVLGGR